jgi:mRNA-degrading endonuclease RelE of RelBE toxin-antitoxin system
MEIFVTEDFEKDYSSLSVRMQEKAKKQEKIFKDNPFYPSLHTEKLHPRSASVWSFRVDRSYRIIFRVLDKNKVIFIAIGPHDWVYRNNLK